MLRQNPLRGDNTGPNPTDRGKTGQKLSVLVEGHGLPIGIVLAGANRHDSPLLQPTLACLLRFGFRLPERITVHMDAGYDSTVTRQTLTVLGCAWQISPKGTFIQINHTKRWVIERTVTSSSQTYGGVDRIDILSTPPHFHILAECCVASLASAHAASPVNPAFRVSYDRCDSCSGSLPVNAA